MHAEIIYCGKLKKNLLNKTHANVNQTPVVFLV